MPLDPSAAQPDEKNVRLQLSEHDAYQLFKLVQKELGQCAPEQRSYWQKMAGFIQDCIERAFGRPAPGPPASENT